MAFNEPLSPKTKMLLASMNAVDDSDSEQSYDSGSYTDSYNGSDIGSVVANLGSQSPCSQNSFDEPEPEILSPKGINLFESVDRRVPNYSGLNIVNGFYRTKIPESTFTLNTFLQTSTRLYGVDMFFKLNNGRTTILKDGRVLDPENPEHLAFLNSILTNVLQWISEFNNSRNSENLDNTQLLFLRETLRTRAPTKRTTNSRGETIYEPGLSNMEKIYGSLGSFNMVMCYRLSTILLLYNMLPTRCPNTIGAKITSEENNFWFYEFRELKMVLSNLVGIIQGLAPDSEQKEYLNEYVIGGLNRLNPDLERVSTGGFFKDFFGTMLNMTGLKTSERRLFESGLDHQRRMMGGAVETMQYTIPVNKGPKMRSCKRMSEAQKEKIVMRKVLEYISQKLGENKSELERIFSDEFMTPNILKKLSVYLSKIQNEGITGGASLAAMTTVGIGISYLFLRLNDESLSYCERKRIAMEILMKQKQAYIMYSVLRVQAQNIYDWTDIYQTYGFNVDDVLHDASSELKTISFLGRNSFTILYSLVHYFINNDNLKTLWNIPLILATTGDRSFDWGKEFALECITRRGNQDVKVIPFIDTLSRVQPTDEFEVIYSSPDCEIVLPRGITFEQMKSWANECLYGSEMLGGALFRTTNIERTVIFEKDTIENQQKRLEQFAMRFFRKRLDIGSSEGKFTLQLNIQRTNTMEIFNTNTHPDFSHELVKSFLINNIGTIGEPRNDIPITEGLLDYSKNIFENNNIFLRGMKRKTKKNRRKSKRKTKKNRKKTKLKKSKRKTKKNYRKTKKNRRSKRKN